jgi:phosphinothricin acetyltransferase
MSYTFEQVTKEHGAAVLEIFNHYVATDFSAYRTVPVGKEFFDAFYQVTRGYPFVAIRHDENDIVGFASLHPYHSAESFAGTAEITYFILPEHTGKGLGSRILNQFISDAKERSIGVILASISSLNEGSISFHQRHGFKECGRFRNVGRKFDKDFDLVWMQLDL